MMLRVTFYGYLNGKLTKKLDHVFPYGPFDMALKWPLWTFTLSWGFTQVMKGPYGEKPYGQYMNNVAWSSCVSSMNFDLNFIFSLILKMTQFGEEMIERVLLSSNSERQMRTTTPMNSNYNSQYKY